jgi:2'-5' RNA ligase
VNAEEVFGLVFDLPEEDWTREIRRLRAIHDHARINFPVEITVAGSSGLGWFSPGQGPELIADEVRSIARDVAPFSSFFSAIEKFSKSHVYYLALKDEKPLHAFQAALAASSMRFELTPFAYKPHCTIVELSNDASASTHAEIAALPVPVHGISIRSLSLYGVIRSRNECRFIWSLPLGS